MMGANAGIIRAICISEKKGTRKHEIREAVLKESWGIEGDAHAGRWHRQVSLLGLQQIESNAEALGIPITIFESEIFNAVDRIDKNPCYIWRQDAAGISI